MELAARETGEGTMDYFWPQGYECSGNMDVGRRGFSGLYAWIVLLLLPLFAGCVARGPKTGTSGLDSQQHPTWNVRVMEGVQEIPEDLLVPKGTALIIRPGTHLRIGPNVRIHVEGRIIARGTQEKPIVFSSAKDGTYWRGINIKGSEKPPKLNRFWNWLTNGDSKAEAVFFDRIRNGNWFEHCVFRNLATAKIQYERANKWRGTIEAYDAALRVKNCRFENVVNFGGVLSQRSYVVVDGNQFDSRTLRKAINSTDRVVGILFNNTIRGHRTENIRCADGIWIKTFVGLIANNLIETVADDGLDLDGSRTIVIGNKIVEAHDDGIDVSNEGLAYLIRNQISGVTDNGVLVSNGSQVFLDGDRITKNVAGLTARDGGWVQGRHMEISDNRTGVLLFQQIPCALTKADYQRVKSQIQAMPLDEIRKQQELEVVRKAEDDASSTAVADMLDRYYSLKGDRFVLSIEQPESLGELDDLMKVFKLNDIFGTQYVTTPETDADPLCQSLKTRVSLADSSVTSNKLDVAPFHGYEMEFASTRFSDAGTTRDVESRVKPFSKHLNIEMNTSALETSAHRIIQELGRLDVSVPPL